jgi:hypothetical protein
VNLDKLFTLCTSLIFFVKKRICFVISENEMYIVFLMLNFKFFKAVSGASYNNNNNHSLT